MYKRMVLLMPVLLPTLVIKAVCDNETENGVIVKYSGHAEANYLPEQKIFIDNNPSGTTADLELLETQTSTTNNEIHHITTTTQQPPTPIEYLDETEGVVFIPNDAPTMRLEDEYETNGVRLKDLLSRKTADDLMDGRIRIETEAPRNEIVFIPGSNNEYTDKKENEDKKENSGRRSAKEKEERRVSYTEHKLDCTNLECNNSMKSICGGKIVNRKLYYRLFLNDCYFRKVNCNFKYEMNRYSIVPSDKCIKYGAHGERPFSFTRKVYDEPKQKEDLSLRRSFSSRRSMSMNMNGKFCSHPCPISCPEDYEPECAVSATGQRRVFMNHCKLDDNSCLFSIVWHLRPLSECVGGKKADMRQNRNFIGWMHQVGIIDNKGKLVLQ